MNILLLIVIADLVIGFTLFTWDAIYCYEKNGGKHNNELHARAYEVDSKVGSWWRKKLGKLWGNVIGVALMIIFWFIWIPVHRIMIKKLFEKERQKYNNKRA